MTENRPELDERPPLLGRWRNIYLVVIGALLAQIVIYTVLTKVYS
jgi:hypothetical protein